MDTLQPLGPDAIRQRIAQIRSRMAQLQPQAPESFSGLTGNLGGLSGTLGGTTDPVNPFGQGTGLQGSSASPALAAKIAMAARNNGVDPALFDAIIQAESGYDPNSVSKVGAKGLSQLMPQTAADMGVTNPFDPDQSLNGGAKYLSSLLKQFPKVEDAVAAYNAGPGAVLKHGGIPNYPETRAYVERVMGLYRGKKG